jgi:U4/U6 small nuclear ribonucleoprotein PRP3
LKRQRKLRRSEKQGELQDLQAAGLIPAPEPRLTLQNFIKVLGDQAFLDPSKYEQKVVAQIQARQSAHEQRNLERKLTKEQRAQKVDSKLQNQVDGAVAKAQVHVALFFVKNTSHAYHRTKLDLNARQWKITGGVLECPATATFPVSCVICEGSAQAIHKYIRLLTVRMNWTSGPDGDEEDDDDDNAMEEELDNEETNQQQVQQPHKFDPTNRCILIWQGMATKRNFPHFSFQTVDAPEQCRKILKQKGLAHYWDQVMQVAQQNSGDATTTNMVLKLAKRDYQEEDDDDNEDTTTTRDADGDVTMAAKVD